MAKDLAPILIAYLSVGITLACVFLLAVGYNILFHLHGTVKHIVETHSVKRQIILLLFALVFIIVIWPVVIYQLIVNKKS